MTIFKTVAAWLDPEAANAASEVTFLREVRASNEEATAELSTRLDAVLKGNAVLRSDLIAATKTVADQATAIAGLRAALKKALPYVADALDDALAATEKGTAKKREAAKAVFAAVQADFEIVAAGAK